MHHADLERLIEKLPLELQDKVRDFVEFFAGEVGRKAQSKAQVRLD